MALIVKYKVIKDFGSNITAMLHEINQWNCCIKHFNLSLFNNSNYKFEESAEEITKQIFYMKNFETFFIFESDFDNNLFRALASHLQSETQLEKLHVIVPNESADQALLEIIQALEHLTNLKELKLIFSSSFGYPKKSLSLLSIYLASMSRLKTFQFSLRWPFPFQIK